MNPKQLLVHIKKSTWYKQGASIAPFFTLPYTSMFTEVGPENTVVVQNKLYNLGYFGKEQERQRAYKHIKRYLKNPNLLVDDIRKWRRLAIGQQSQLEKILYFEPREKDKLKRLISDHKNLTINAWTPTLLIEDLDPWGEEILLDYTKQYNLTHDQIATLTGPNKFSYVQRERIDWLKIAKKYSKQAVKKHWKKYYWILASWESAPKTEVKYFDNLIKKDQQNFKKAQNEVRLIQNHLQNEQKKRKQLLRKFNFDPKTKKLFWIFSQLSDLRDERKMECMAKINYSLARFIQKLAQYNGLPEDLLYYLHISDLESFSLSKLLVEILRKRKNGLYIFYGINKQQEHFVYGEQAKEIARALQESVSGSKKELRGRVAFTGMVRGIVRIINSINEFGKMNKGDILISINTRPDLMPIIKKAGAIVTDEGGITCHAAIVSRELKIPCIVGTQSATVVFKDGDLVEVDANKGIVRKL